MTPQLEKSDNLVQEKEVLSKTFEEFYKENAGFFSAQDRKLAEKHFYGIGEGLSLQGLLERQRKCVAICEQSIGFAATQRKQFFSLLTSLPIAFDRKKTLREQFLAGDFQIKTSLLDFLYQEEKRIALKREAQRVVIEALKNQFVTFYSSNTLYFNEYDRALAINYAFSSIEKFRTHQGKETRLHMLLAMFPGNLAYARELDEKYKNLLVQNVLTEAERETLLEKFIKSNFAQKNELLKTLPKSIEVKEEKKEELKELEEKVQKTIESTAKEAAILAKIKKETEQQEKPLEVKELKKEASTPSMCEIAIRIIKDDSKKNYKTDQEILEEIEKAMKQSNVLGNFSRENLAAMRNILPRLPEQYWGTINAAIWIKKELQGITVLHEYSN